MKSKTWLWIILLALLWAPAFLFMKVAVQEIPPFTLVAGRVLLAAVVLTVVMWLQKRRFPRFGAVWGRFAVLALFLNVLPYILISWGEQYVDSGLAAILIGTDPLFTMVIAHFFIVDDRLTPTKILGVVVGFGGLGLLAAPQFMDGISATFGGITAVSLAAFPAFFGKPSLGENVCCLHIEMSSSPPACMITTGLSAKTPRHDDQVCMRVLYHYALSRNSYRVNAISIHHPM